MEEIRGGAIAPTADNQSGSVAYKMPFTGLSGGTLKIIACICMVIDHLGCVVVKQYNEAMLETIGYVMMRRLDTIYGVCRSIGRIAFPIFCFLLVEGFFHTRNRWKYLLNMVIFALVTEVPFDLAMKGRVVDWSYQSVYVTLSVGLIMMIACNTLMHDERIPHEWGTFFSMAVIAACAYINYLAKSDYGYKGILLIATLYVFHDFKKTQALCGSAVACFEWVEKIRNITASLSFILIYTYNGKRGIKINKYVFYAFYPVHLFLLYLLRCYLLR